MTTCPNNFPKKKHPKNPGSILEIIITVDKTTTRTYEYKSYIPEDEIELPTVLMELYRTGGENAIKILDDIRVTSKEYPDTMEITIMQKLDYKQGNHIPTILNDINLELAKEDIKQYISDTQEEYHLEFSQTQSMLRDIIFEMNPNLKFHE